MDVRETSQRYHIFSIPDDIFLVILSFIDYVCVFSRVIKTCKKIKRIVDGDRFLRAVLERDFKIRVRRDISISRIKRILILKHRACRILQDILLRKSFLHLCVFYACRGFRMCEILRGEHEHDMTGDKIKQLSYDTEYPIAPCSDDINECCMWLCRQMSEGPHCIWSSFMQKNLAYLAFGCRITVADYGIAGGRYDDDDAIIVIEAARIHLIYIGKWTLEQELEFNLLNTKPYMIRDCDYNRVNNQQVRAIFPTRTERAKFYMRNGIDPLVYNQP